MPLTAVRYVRKMRGGAQSHLLQADDGHHYVVKFSNNPQHRRILVNEIVASTLLEYLQISAPETAFIHVSDQFLSEHPDVYLTISTRRVAVPPGWHFGSRYPGDPEHLAVYDFLPDALLQGVANLYDFRAILVFDKWIANVDGRQCVFYRANVSDGSGAPRPAFVARMIDNGFTFNGPHWDFRSAPLQGLYARRQVYDSVRSLDDFQPWLDQVRHFPEEIIDLALKRVPPDWIVGEEEELEQLLDQLLSRRSLLPELIEASRNVRTNPFPRWTAGHHNRMGPAFSTAKCATKPA